MTRYPPPLPSVVWRRREPRRPPSRGRCRGGSRGRRLLPRHEERIRSRRAAVRGAVGPAHHRRGRLTGRRRSAAGPEGVMVFVSRSPRARLERRIEARDGMLSTASACWKITEGDRGAQTTYAIRSNPIDLKGEDQTMSFAP